MGDIDLTWKRVTDEDNVHVVVDDLALLDQAMLTNFMADHPLSCDPRAHALSGAAQAGTGQFRIEVAPGRRNPVRVGDPDRSA
jgi:hypothetical protein